MPAHVCAVMCDLLEQMECVYHGGCITSLVTSDVSPINTHGGSQLLRQQNMLVEKMVGNAWACCHTYYLRLGVGGASQTLE